MKAITFQIPTTKIQAKNKAWVHPLGFKHTKTPCEITTHIFNTLRLTLNFNSGQRGWEKFFSIVLVKDSTDFKRLPHAQCSPFSTGPRTCSSFYIRYHSFAYHGTLVLWQAVLNTDTDNHFGPRCPLIFSKFRRALSSHGHYLKLLSFMTKSPVNMCKERQQ